eukprot:9249946-Lingulodinium_polyedra.AAC.1
MTRSNRPCAAAAARESHASRTPRERQKRSSHEKREACDLRAAVVADGRFDRVIAHGFKNCPGLDGPAK